MSIIYRGCLSTNPRNCEFHVYVIMKLEAIHERRSFNNENSRYANDTNFGNEVDNELDENCKANVRLVRCVH